MECMYTMYMFRNKKEKEGWLANGDNVLTIYKMKEKPTIRKEIKFDKEIQKVFYNEKMLRLNL